MLEEKIERINELYRKSKAEGLTEEELQEQKVLRAEYIDAFKRNLRGQLNNISIQEKDGTITNLGEKFGNKKQIRKECLKRRKALSKEEWQIRSEKLMAFLIAHPIYKASKTIYCYVSYQGEADTWRFIMYSLKNGKRVAVPKVCGDEMKFYYIHDVEELKEGYKGIFEPPETNKEAAEEKGALFHASCSL